MTQQEFFNRYKYNVRTDKIGGGAFGTVYKAFDEVLNREVAIKVSEVKIIGDKEFSLKDEFDAIKDLPPHKNIANYEELHTIEMPNGVFDYAIMQFYKDGNLSDAIKNGFTEEQKEQISIDLLKGIQHLHHHKIVHRDLKPGNILVVQRQDKIIPVITDFGLSKQTSQEAQSLFSNSFGGGTLKYSSPEQLKGENLRLNTDLWAFGVIVYKIFTGEDLFSSNRQSSASAEAEEEIFQQIKNKDISVEILKVPKTWQEILKLCIVKDASIRIKSASELLEILNSSNPTTYKHRSKIVYDKTTNEKHDKVQSETSDDDKISNTIIDSQDNDKKENIITNKSTDKSKLIILRNSILISLAIAGSSMLIGFLIYIFLGREYQTYQVIITVAGPGLAVLLIFSAIKQYFDY